MATSTKSPVKTKSPSTAAKKLPPKVTKKTAKKVAKKTLAKKTATKKSVKKVDRRPKVKPSETSAVKKPETKKVVEVSTVTIQKVNHPVKVEKPENKSKSKDVDLKRYPIQREAINHYNRGTLLFGEKDGQGHPAPRKFLLHTSLGFLADSLGRQLDAEDLRLLLKDEGFADCVVTKKKFRVISWAILNKKSTQKTGELTRQGVSFQEIVNKSIFAFKGSFFVPKGSEEYIALSGTPFPDTRNNEVSALKKAQEEGLIPGWGTTLKGAQRQSVANKKHHKNVEENKENMNKGLNSLSDFDFGSTWSPGQDRRR